MKTIDKSDNELIAEFMDLDIDGKNVTDGEQETTIDKLKYHISWDWLMPVVEKIGKMHNSKFTYDPIEIAKGNFPNDDQYMNVITLPLYTTIEDSYKAVVEFIKWFNSQSNG